MIGEEYKAALFLVSKEPNLMCMLFGSCIGGVTITPDQTVENIESIRAATKDFFGDVKRSISDVPIEVSVDKAAGLVVTRFPRDVNMMVACPEVFLAWADKLEQAVMQIGASA